MSARSRRSSAPTSRCAPPRRLLANAIARLYEAGHERDARLSVRERVDAAWSDARYAFRCIRDRAVGLALGSAIAVGAARFVETLLFRTSPRSPSAFAAAATLIAIVAVAATFIPAWRASRVDPVTALRSD